MFDDKRGEDTTWELDFVHKRMLSIPRIYRRSKVYDIALEPTKLALLYSKASINPSVLLKRRKLNNI